MSAHCAALLALNTIIIPPTQRQTVSTEVVIVDELWPRETELLANMITFENKLDLQQLESTPIWHTLSSALNRTCADVNIIIRISNFNQTIRKFY